MPSVGIVGMGGMGRFHARRYGQLGRVRVQAIADIVPERLDSNALVEINLSDSTSALDLTGVARYGEGMDLIRETDVDIVDICLPTYLHADYTIAALEAGHHVLCEKPMALTVEDADRMVAASTRSGRLLMVAQVVRFWPEYEFLYDAVAQGTYGRLLSLNMWRIAARPGWSSDNWFLDPELSGGPILDLHIHDVDYVNALLGMPDRVYATGRMSSAAKAHDVLHAVFTYKDGPQIHMHAGWSAGQVPFAAGYEAWFDEALVAYRAGSLSVAVGRGADEAMVPDLSGGDGYLAEIAYFLSCVASEGEPSRCLPASSRDSMQLVSVELASMASGEAVTPGRR